MAPSLCHCGRPLHYSDPALQRKVEEIVERLGECIVIRLDDGRAYKVPRHYIALHGLKAWEVAGLGFERA